jgi:hypothetical protein
MGEVLWQFGQQYRGFLLVPLLYFMAELLHGSRLTGSVIKCIPWSRCYFWTTVQFSKTAMTPFTQLELFNHGLNSMKVIFSTSSLATTVTTFEYHWTTLVSFGD